MPPPSTNHPNPDPERSNGTAPERWGIDDQVHVVKLGLNYRFH